MIPHLKILGFILLGDCFVYFVVTLVMPAPFLNHRLGEHVVGNFFHPHLKQIRQANPSK